MWTILRIGHYGWIEDLTPRRIPTSLPPKSTSELVQKPTRKRKGIYCLFVEERVCFDDTSRLDRTFFESTTGRCCELRSSFYHSTRRLFSSWVLFSYFLHLGIIQRVLVTLCLDTSYIISPCSWLLACPRSCLTPVHQISPKASPISGEDS